MQVRTNNILNSDEASAKVFFDALFSFYAIPKDALDMFARDGSLTVKQYAYKVANLDVWELNPEHREKLFGFKPRDVIIGDSYLTLSQCSRQYDLVVIDSPQGLHQDMHGNLHAEHFGVLPKLRPILKQRAVIVLYVNKNPYNKDTTGSHGYDEYPEYNFERWMDARGSFYHSPPQHLTEEVALKTYRQVLGQQNIKVLSTLSVPCYSDVDGLEPYAYRLGLEVEVLPEASAINCTAI